MFSPVPCDSGVSVDLIHTSLRSIWRNLEEHRGLYLKQQVIRGFMNMWGVYSTCGPCAPVRVRRGRCGGPSGSSAGAAHVSAVDVEIKALLQELQLLLTGVFLLQSPQSPDITSNIKIDFLQTNILKHDLNL